MNSRHPLLYALLLSAVMLPNVAQAGEVSWFKGNTHTHSLWSDGNDFPEMITRFYRDRGYQFLVLSDHNVLSRGERWVTVDAVEKRRKAPGPSILGKYIEAFGEDWVEIRGEGDRKEVRLKTLREIRPAFEAPGEFLFIEGEEITDRFERHEIHTNAIHVDEAIAPRHGDSLRATMRNNLLAVREQETRLNRPILAHLNHPNFAWSITADDIAHVLEERFVEVYNGHPGVNHLGDETRPGAEKIWDIANTIRLAELGGGVLFGLASDDAHYYHGGDVKPGRGWIMVQADTLSPDSLIQAMRAGRFYASTGVSLNEVLVDFDAGELRISIAPVAGESYTTAIVGTRRGNETTPAKVGETLATFTGPDVSYRLQGDEWYVRATITSDAAHPIPSFAGQRKQAWTQPVLPPPPRLP